jgi:HD superfamily phosphohydrolase
MTIKDRVYGELKISEPVIVEIINSKPFQRLKGISQDGAAHYIQPQRDVTRYEHSIGVWHLSAHYGRPLPEQIASLVHDVPHTAFSHVIDFVMQDAEHEYHDKFTKKIILESEIPAILEKHGVDLESVLNKEDYQLLENSLPDISVDRLDYFLRDGVMFGVLPVEVARMFLEHLQIEDQVLHFDEQRVAALFALLFINCSRLIWLDPTSHGAFFLIAESL